MKRDDLKAHLLLLEFKDMGGILVDKSLPNFSREYASGWITVTVTFYRRKVHVFVQQSWFWTQRHHRLPIDEQWVSRHHEKVMTYIVEIHQLLQGRDHDV